MINIFKKFNVSKINSISLRQMLSRKILNFQFTNRLILKAKKNGTLEKINNIYWIKHNVTSHYKFKNAMESLNYFDWRNAQYHNYLQLMPVSGHDNKVILDYGCGPGHDLVGFGCYSKPKHIIGADVSISSLSEAKYRLSLHQITAELIDLSKTNAHISLGDHSVDYIHSSGVLHHVANLPAILQEFKRIIKPNGKIRIMVYNYDSIWLHLYVAYYKKILEGKFSELDIRTAFSKTTDGPNCPIANVYTSDEFMKLISQQGFKVKFLGAAIAIYEMKILEHRFEAIMNQRLSKEHRDFLLSLTFDEQGYPLYKGHYAGVDGCYEIEIA